MSSSQPDRTWSYEKHARHESEVAAQGHLPSSYTDPDSVDNWRHSRMREGLLPILGADPEATWVTIGDGNYGSDAHFLSLHGPKALATSLTDVTLVTAAEKGFIKSYQAENAETLSFEDKAFDYSLCKAAYHHFPRPPIAFYEMIRVSRKAAVFIEPDQGSGRILNRLKNRIKALIRGDESFEFEVSGNYIFRLSVEEVEKMVTAMNGSTVAHKRFNDFYHPAFGGDKATSASKGLRITRLGILVQDILCRLGLLDWGLVTVIAFTSPPGETLRRKLRESGFTVKDLPKNPYL